MTLETEKTRNDETKRLGDEARERELERRLAADLDAFLATVGDDAFFFADEEEKAKENKTRPTANATRRTCKRRIFEKLSTAIAASALLCVVVSSTFVYFVSQKKETRAKTASIASVDAVGDETSLVAWSVEKWNATEQATLWRQVEERWVNVDVLSGWEETTGDADGAENVLALNSETGGAANEAERGGQGDKNEELDAIAWNDALSGEGISLTLWTYDPLLQIAALLQ
ncbi:MAG: hypothetical protein IJ991_03810 [Thermoguttaceae bacterium]|nr:hypothetical protein [Thermoguttaceae bacterium]